jgi:hypothetical protein
MAIDKKSLGVLKSCLDNNSLVIFSGDGTDVVFQTDILEIEKDYVALTNKVPPEYITKIVNSKSFGLQAQMMRFTSAKIDSDGERILFPLKDLKVIEETRGAERFPFTAEEHVVCELLNPYDQKTILTKSVLDMSATGFSIRSASASQLFRPGLLFKQTKVLIDGESYKKSAARVVYHRKLFDHKGKLRVQVGFKLE